MDIVSDRPSAVTVHAVIPTDFRHSRREMGDSMLILAVLDNAMSKSKPGTNRNPNGTRKRDGSCCLRAPARLVSLAFFGLVIYQISTE